MSEECVERKRPVADQAKVRALRFLQNIRIPPDEKHAACIRQSGTVVAVQCAVTCCCG